MNQIEIISCEIEDCRRPRLRGERFCYEHRKQLLDHLDKVGYRQRLRTCQRFRGSDAQENVLETKRGTGDGSGH